MPLTATQRRCIPRLSMTRERVLERAGLCARHPAARSADDSDSSTSSTPDTKREHDANTTRTDDCLREQMSASREAQIRHDYLDEREREFTTEHEPRSTHNPKVAGLNPAPATNETPGQRPFPSRVSGRASCRFDPQYNTGCCTASLARSAGASPPRAATAGQIPDLGVRAEPVPVGSSSVGQASVTFGS